MATIRQRPGNIAPDVEYGEIFIPDDTDLGTGRFTTSLKPGAMSGQEEILSVMKNVPVFEISMNIDFNTQAIPVSLGKADDTPPLSRKVFILPEDVNPAKKHTFVTNFQDWEIKSLVLDGKALTAERD